MRVLKFLCKKDKFLSKEKSVLPVFYRRRAASQRMQEGPEERRVRSAP